MANDDRYFTVFGLTFIQHHNLHMQQILREYSRLPPGPPDRAEIFMGLFELSKQLDREQIDRIEKWLRDGGEFPSPVIDEDMDEDGELVWEKQRSQFMDVEEESDEEESDEEESDEEESDEEDTDSEREFPEYNSENYETPDSAALQQQDQQPFESISSESELDHTETKDSDSAPPPPAPRQGDRSEIYTSSITEPVPENGDIECNICSGTYPLSDFPPKNKVTKNCEHDHDYQACSTCIQQSIQSTLDEGALHRIICVFCHEKLSYDEIKHYATPETFARYEYLNLISLPNAIMCLGPKCGAPQAHTSDSPIMTCTICQFRTCVVHKLPWHEDQTCEEFDTDDRQIERLEQAEATAKLLAKEESKICPNCKQGVYRIEGCDHLSCRCGKEWCFLCLTSWENIMRVGKEAHNISCPSHPRYIPPSKSQREANQNKLTSLVHGGPVSEALEKARGVRQERIRGEIRNVALKAAEKRARETKEEKQKMMGEGEKSRPKRKKLSLKPAWEEGGNSRRSFGG